MRRPLPALARYGGSVAAFALVVGASFAIRRLWGFSIDTTALIILVMIASAWYGGRGPGLVVAFLFEAVIDYFSGWPKDPLRYGVLAFNRLLLFTSVVIFASARRSAEDRLTRQQEALRETLERERAARTEAETASRAKDEFLATVSHELRTPLNGILGWAAILNRHDVNAAVKTQALRTIERSALAQAQIVEDILDFSGMARGQLRIDPQPVALAPLVRDAIDTVAASADLKQIRIETVIEEDQVIVGDSGRCGRSSGTCCRTPSSSRPRGAGSWCGCGERQTRPSSKWRTPASGSIRHSCRTPSNPSGRPTRPSRASTADWGWGWRSFVTSSTCTAGRSRRTTTKPSAGRCSRCTCPLPCLPPPAADESANPVTKLPVPASGIGHSA